MQNNNYSFQSEEDHLVDLPVIIRLKNGASKYGILLDYSERKNQADENNQVRLKFICNSQFNNYLQTKNPALIEYFSVSSIAYLDRFFK